MKQSTLGSWHAALLELGHACCFLPFLKGVLMVRNTAFEADHWNAPDPHQVGQREALSNGAHLLATGDHAVGQLAQLFGTCNCGVDPFVFHQLGHERPAKSIVRAVERCMWQWYLTLECTWRRR